jgi:hypothetical protein
MGWDDISAEGLPNTIDYALATAFGGKGARIIDLF